MPPIGTAMRFNSRRVVSAKLGSLPIAAAGRAGFAAVYLLQLLALPFVVHAGRRLRESPRFVAHVAERHGYRELLRRPLSRRVALVGGVAFLTAIFFAPTAEFFTRYLDDVRHFGDQAGETGITAAEIDDLRASGAIPNAKERAAAAE